MSVVKNSYLHADQSTAPTVTAEPLTTPVDNPRASAGVLVKARDTNPEGSYVYIGGPGLTATGLRLAPGEACSFPVEDPSKVYHLATVEGCVTEWGYL